MNNPDNRQIVFAGVVVVVLAGGPAEAAELKILETLGNDPVSTESVEKGLRSKSLRKAAEAVAVAGEFSEAKTFAFFAAIDTFEAQIIAASKDPHYNSGNVRSSVAEKGMQVIMGNGEVGGYTAEHVELQLKDQEAMVTFTFSYTEEDGKKRTETVYILVTCSNPAVDASPDIIVPQPLSELARADECSILTVGYEMVHSAKGIMGPNNRLLQDVPLFTISGDGAGIDNPLVWQALKQDSEFQAHTKDPKFNGLVLVAINTKCGLRPEQLWCVVRSGESVSVSPLMVEITVTPSMKAEHRLTVSGRNRSTVAKNVLYNRLSPAEQALWWEDTP